MTSIQIVKPDNDPAKNNEQTAQTTSITHDVGQILSDSSQVMAPPVNLPKFFQTMPQNTLSDFLTRPTEIANITISNSDTQFSTITTLDPWALFLANPRIVDKTTSYLYIRGTIELMIMTAVPGNCFGSYIFTGVANGGIAETSGGLVRQNNICPDTLNYTACMQVDNYVRLDCSASENMVMQFPFLWPYDYAMLPTGPANSWSVQLFCLAPLNTAIPSGNSVGTIKVFARLLDGYEIVVPHLQGKSSHKGHLTQHPLLKQFAPHLAEAAQTHQGEVSGIADKVSAVADKLANIPVIGAYAQTASKAAHAVSKVASFFGFTRDEAQTMPIPIVQHSTSNVANYDGSDPSLVAALTAGNGISIDPTMSGMTDRDVLSTTDFFDRWTLVSSFSWSPSQVQDTTLGSVPITPFFGISSGDNAIRLTTAGYFGLPFSYWRGDMEYLIVIPVSKLHRGTLQVLWLPVGSSLTSTVTNSTLNTIYDVTADGEKEFLVGYARDIPFLPCMPMISSTPQNYGVTNGRLVFRVINPLTSQSDTAVNVLVFAKASSNMEFAVLRSSLYNTVRADPEYDVLGSIRYQGASGDEDAHESEQVELVKASGDYPMEDVLFGERVESIRAMLQKPSRIMTSTPIVNTAEFNWQILDPLGPSGKTYTYNVDNNYWYSDSWNLSLHYRIPFTGFAASQRYKLFPNSDSWVGAGPWVTESFGYQPPTFCDFPNDLAPMTFCGPNKGYEVTVPYYQSKKFLLSRLTFGAGPNDLKGKYNVIWQRGATGDLPSTYDAVLYTSYGPDIRCVGFRGIPEVVIGAAPNITTHWFPNQN